ncbi:hypothetical protein Athai_46040 [Actinocatenispora thailandica]|uniref:Uncharacterized protein n=1 Tax=Actinocatenispora thailandica TaxID=227318 RepID=A0A7R7HYZ9_9ACTN|nr:hypothetical protein [Actinocatenispora thailandica]BCJ37101.1 hypothetical protein Athai_46040 [Actinocatenispora thailandica]
MVESTKHELEMQVHGALAGLDDEAYAAALYVAARDLAFMYDGYMSDRVRDLTRRTVRCLQQPTAGDETLRSALADEWEAVYADDDEDGPAGYSTMMLTFMDAVGGIRARDELEYLTSALGDFPTIAGVWAPVRLDDPEVPADETEYGVRMLRRLGAAVPAIAELTAHGLDPETIRSGHLPPPPEPPNLRTVPTLEQHCITLVAEQRGTLAGLVLEFVASFRWAMLGQRLPVTELATDAERAAVARLRPVVEQLAVEGRLELYRLVEITGEQRRLTGESIGPALADPKVWSNRDGGTGHAVRILPAERSSRPAEPPSR